MANTFLNFDNPTRNANDDIFKEIFEENGKDLNLVLFNIRSLSRHLDDFIGFTNKMDIHLDIMAFSECWLLHNVCHRNINGFDCFVNNSGLNKASGVAIYINKRLHAREIDGPFFKNIDILWVQCPGVINGKDLVLILIYRSPSLDKLSFIKIWKKILDFIVTNRYNVILIGDLNFDFLATNCAVTNKFISIAAENGLRQVLTKPTRDRAILDHCWTNITIPTNSVIVKNNLTDHLPIFVSLEVTPNQQTQKDTYEKVNYDRTILELNSYNYHAVLEANDVNLGLNILIDMIKKSLKNNTKRIVVKKNSRYVNPKRPWITEGILRSIKRRDKWMHKLKKNPMNNKLKDRLKKYKCCLNALLRKSKSAYYKEYFESNKCDSKGSWKMINSVLNRKNKSSSFVEKLNIINKDKKKEVITDSKEICDCFNSYLVNVGKHEGIHQYENSLPYLKKSIFMKPTDNTEISSIIKSLKNSCAVGPDKISVKILKGADALIPAVTHLVNVMLSTGTFPDKLKEARVVVLHKKGSKSDMSCYRPISVLNTMSKIFEKILHNRISNFFERNNILSNVQNGFRKFRSTDTAHLAFSNYVNKAIDEGKLVGALSLDFSKAFDSLSHDILFSKLERYGVRGYPLELIKSYMKHRRQYVTCNDQKSTVAELAYGVPQGSILGPLLFAIFINDIVNNMTLDVNMILFADDCLIFASHKDWLEVMEKLQSEVNRIILWTENNVMRLNELKSVLLVLGTTIRVGRIKNLSSLHVYIKNARIYCSREMKFLGIWYDSTMKFNKHISNICKKSGLYVRTFYSLKKCFPVSVLMQIYHSLFISTFTFGIVIFGNNYKTNVNRLQSIQNRILKIIFGIPKRKTARFLYEKHNLLDICKLYAYACICVFIKMHINDVQVHNVNIKLSRKQRAYKLRYKFNFYYSGLPFFTKYGEHVFENRLKQILNFLLLEGVDFMNFINLINIKQIVKSYLIGMNRKKVIDILF